MEWLEALGQALGAMKGDKALSIIGAVLSVIVSAFVAWAKGRAKRAEKAMQSVPPTPVPALPSVVQLLTELDQERRARLLEYYRAGEAEQSQRRAEEESRRLADALTRERQAHAAAVEQLMHYRAYAHELEQRARALDSGFTPLLSEPFEAPTQIVEVDASPTIPPGRKRR